MVQALSSKMKNSEIYYCAERRQGLITRNPTKKADLMRSDCTCRL